MIISAMVAVGKNNVIGKNNDIPWRLPNDWTYLRRITMRHSIILGRKNYESIGKPLDGRKNIILTKNKNYKAEGCHIAYSMPFLNVKEKKYLSLEEKKYINNFFLTLKNYT